MRHTKILSLRAISLAFGLTLWTGSSFAQSALIGAWNTVSIVSERDGQKTELFGHNVKGIQIFDASGRFAIIAMRDDLPKIASKNRQTATAEEALKI